MRTRTLATLLALAGSSLHAQQATLVGTWQLSFPIGMQVDNGVPTPILGTGMLTVEAVGDSLIATLVTDHAPDMPARPPARLAAGMRTGEAVFTSHAPGQINMNGEERDINVISTWTLTATGDNLAGTVQRQIEGFDGLAQDPQPVSGARQKP